MAEDTKQYTEMQLAAATEKANRVKASMEAENISLPESVYKELVLGFLKNDFKARIDKMKENSGTGRKRGKNND